MFLMQRSRDLSTNQILILYCVNQSEISIVLSQPIRGEYYLVGVGAGSRFRRDNIFSSGALGLGVGVFSGRPALVR